MGFNTFRNRSLQYYRTTCTVSHCGLAFVTRVVTCRAVIRETTIRRARYFKRTILHALACGESDGGVHYAWRADQEAVILICSGCLCASSASGVDNSPAHEPPTYDHRGTDPAEGSRAPTTRYSICMSVPQRLPTFLQLQRQRGDCPVSKQSIASGR